MKRFFIVAGEISGDRHAARLMDALRLYYPGCVFEGIGGDEMKRRGLDSLVALQDINVVGFWEVARKYSFFKKLLARCAERLRSSRYDAFIPVDYPGFNLRLAAEARRCGTPVCFYIAPQLWAWGRGRAAKLRDTVDMLMVVFPFEKEFFERFGIRTEFVGHPLLDDPDFASGFAPLEQRQDMLALLPGSRRQEVRSHLPVLLEASRLVRTVRPSTEVVVAAPAGVDPQLYDEARDTARIEHNSREVMKRARVGIVKTGTSNLEAALCGMPFVMMYKTSTLSYLLARHLVDLPHISLVNIILGRPVVRECIQSEASPRALADELLRLLDNRQAAAEMQHEFACLRTQLGDGGAARRAAGCIATVIDP